MPGSNLDWDSDVIFLSPTRQPVG